MCYRCLLVQFPGHSPEGFPQIPQTQRGPFFIPAPLGSVATRPPVGSQVSLTPTFRWYPRPVHPRCITASVWRLHLPHRGSGLFKPAESRRIRGINAAYGTFGSLDRSLVRIRSALFRGQRSRGLAGAIPAHPGLLFTPRVHVPLFQVSLHHFLRVSCRIRTGPWFRAPWAGPGNLCTIHLDTHRAHDFPVHLGDDQSPGTFGPASMGIRAPCRSLRLPQVLHLDIHPELPRASALG